jgi:hypothetical protein
VKYRVYVYVCVSLAVIDEKIVVEARIVMVSVQQVSKVVDLRDLVISSLVAAANVDGTVLVDVIVTVAEAVTST